MVAILKISILASAVAISICALSPIQATPVVDPTTAVLRRRIAPVQQAAGFVPLQEREDESYEARRDLRIRVEKFFHNFVEQYKTSSFPFLRLMAEFEKVLQKMREKQTDIRDQIAVGVSRLRGPSRKSFCASAGLLLRKFGVDCD
ncbi:hypothetical protein BGZ96_012042 [Linnemannia gamsii]|uniref:Uncharacterized protein n=1 Tax=Linnemannia gamsii TaxID=64522 RepID=A0ABQ7JR34_9FUNG|nr:hypothetical protein BGZ96_012042 [Linnemannia gamsii]